MLGYGDVAEHYPLVFPRLLRDARAVFTINSAPSIICGAVRSEFWHVLDNDPQNDAISPASRIL